MTGTVVIWDRIRRKSGKTSGRTRILYVVERMAPSRTRIWLRWAAWLRHCIDEEAQAAAQSNP